MEPTTLNALLFNARLGENLRNARKSNNLTLQQVAELMGTRKSKIHNIERGLRNISAYDLARLSLIYRVTPDSLTGITLEEAE